MKKNVITNQYDNSFQGSFLSNVVKISYNKELLRLNGAKKYKSYTCNRSFIFERENSW